MFTVTVDKKDLLTRLYENRDEHRNIFLQAIDGYRTFVTARLEERIARLQEGNTIEEYVRFTIPEDHTDDYDRVIGMLEMDLSDEIDLEESMFRMYVNNDWDWAKNFAITNSTYTQLSGTSYNKYL